MTRLLKYTVIIIAAAVIAGCSGAPGEDGLRESFAQQLAANKFIKDFQKSGEDLTFTGPGAEGGVAKWRVHIDSAVVEPIAKDDPDYKESLPFKGTVKSSWYSDDRLVTPRGRDSNLPIELTSNGLAQECWGLWDKAAGKWGWE